MSKKRTSLKPGNDEHTNEGSDSNFQQDDNAKRAKLASLSDTTLQDLPIELIECILIEAVVMEVKGMKLVKNVWKEKADLVISRLRTVCLQWSSILTTNFFRNALHRTLDETALKTIHMESLHQSLLQFAVPKVTTMKDEIFMLRKQEKIIIVFDCNNMAEVKDVIRLPGTDLLNVAACSMSNCLYILNRKSFYYVSILRIMRDDEHQFKISTLISVMWLPNPTLSVSSNGSIILSRWLRPLRSEPSPVISMYNANGSLQHEIRLSSDFSSFRAIIPKSNGNLVLVSTNDQLQAKLTEVDMDGTIVRQYQSSLRAYGHVCQADIYGRILILNRRKGMELLDSELNLLNFTCSPLDEGQFILSHELQYNRERNEVLAIVRHALTIYHFTE